MLSCKCYSDCDNSDAVDESWTQWVIKSQYSVIGLLKPYDRYMYACMYLAYVLARQKVTTIDYY